MLHIKDSVKMVSVDDIFAANGNDVYSAFIDTKNSYIAPKDFTCVFALFNGLLNKDQILEVMSQRWGKLESERYLNEIQSWGIVEEVTLPVYCCKTELSEFIPLFLNAKVAYDNIPTLAIDVVIILSFFGNKKAFFSCEDRVIVDDDYNHSIFIMKKDIGMKVSSFLKTMGIEAAFEKEKMESDTGYVCNISFGQSVTKSEDDNTINLLANNYRTIKNFGFGFFDANMDLSENVRKAVEEFVWAFRICEDLFFSIGNGTYT